MKTELGSWNSKSSRLERIRVLNDDEVEFDQKSRPIVAEARERLNLFRILELNYNAWCNNLRKLATPGPVEDNADLVLNQLLLNFLTTVYTIKEHFDISYRQRFKKDPLKIKEKDDFMNSLIDASWAVGFCLDFRNYVQHNSLPVGNYKRNETAHGVCLSILQDAEKLTAGYRGWKKSNLVADRGELDLIELTEECYRQMRKSYGGFVSKTFYPELVEIDSFYWSLTKEIRRIDPQGRMIFVSDSKESKTRVAKKLSFTYEVVPNALFDELGITIDRENHNNASKRTASTRSA